MRDGVGVGVERAAQLRLQQAVHDEVGVAADRRGEVAVRLARQAEVGREEVDVAGALERAQQQRVDEQLLRAVVRERDDALERRRRGAVHVLDRVVELLEHDRDLRERVGVRVLVDAVDHRRLGVAHVPRDDLVGGDHRLLDHVRRHRALAQHDLDRLAVLVEPHLRLDRLEVEPAARDPALADVLGDAREVAERELALAVGERLRRPSSHRSTSS